MELEKDQSDKLVKDFEMIERLEKQDQVNRRITENEFRSKLLPVIVAEHPDLADIWVMLTGDLLYTLDVVDDVSGELLFKIPPYLSSLTTHNNNLDGGMPRFLDEYVKQSKTSPVQAEAEFATVMDEVAGELPSTYIASDILVWYYIMCRYNVVIPRFTDYMESLGKLWEKVHGYKLTNDNLSNLSLNDSAAKEVFELDEDQEFEDL